MCSGAVTLMAVPMNLLLGNEASGRLAAEGGGDHDKPHSPKAGGLD